MKAEYNFARGNVAQVCRDLARLYTTSPDGSKLIPTTPSASSSSQPRSVWPQQPASFDCIGRSETAAPLLSFEEAVLRLAGLVPLPIWDTDLHQSLIELSKPSTTSASSSASLSSPRTVLNMYGCMDNLLYSSDISSTHLRQYLILVLENLSTCPNAGQPSSAAAHQSQRTMLATWIFELYLHDLSKYLLNMQVLINIKDSDLWSILPPVPIPSQPAIPSQSTVLSTVPSAAPAKAATVWDYLTFTPVSKDASEPPQTAQTNKPAASAVVKDAKDGSRIDMMLATQDQLNTLEDELKQFLSTYK